MSDLTQMGFEQKWLLWLLILPLLLFAYSFVKNKGKYHARILRSQLFLFSICLLALANPLIYSERQTGQASVVLDVSSSFDQQLASQLYAKARQLTAGLDNVSTLIFAGSSKLKSSDSTLPSFGSLTGENLKATTTNIEQALKDAAALSKNIILISDGYQNRGNVFDSLSTLNSRVFPLVPDQIQELANQGLEILSLEHPMVVDSKKSAEIITGLFNSSSVSKKAKLKIFDGEKEILNKDVEVAAGKGISVKTLSDPDKSGIRKIRAELHKQDSVVEKGSFISSKQAEKILLLNGSTEDGDLLKQAFDGRSYELVNSLNSHQLSEFSVVALNNIANRQLPDGLLSRLPEYVRKGGSLVVIGGNRSYSLGGYIDSALEDLLPVELVPPKGQEKRLTIAVSLIIDKSRSMADDRKLDFAKEAAREVVKNLKDEDFVGVIGFDLSPFEVVKMGQLSKIRNEALERIGRLFPAQNTNLFPAIDEGRRRLAATQAGRKHMIILTDGKIPDADQSYLELVKEMRINGITVSTVLVGSDYEFGFLKQLAERGGGAFYQTSDPSSLPRIFMQDVKVKSGDQAQKEQGSYTVNIGNSGILSTTIEKYPELAGFVETKPKDKARHELVVESDKGDFPLLSSWSVDQGKVFAFTSDANGRWSRSWAGWGKFANFWTELIDSARGDKQQNSLKYDLRTEIEGNQLVLDLATFEDPSGPMQIYLEDPKGVKRELNFTKLRRGSYRAKIAVNPETAQYTFSGKAGDKSLTPVSFELEADKFTEKSGKGFNFKVLSEIAEQTGGRLNPEAQNLKSEIADKTVTRSLRNELLIFGLIFYFLSIVARELSARPVRVSRVQ